jgi:ATP-dependent helicase YprA (DUF1998 family)
MSEELDSAQFKAWVRPPITADHIKTVCVPGGQSEAIVLDHENKSFVVTTGTGSGKSICYFIPIINAALSSRPPETRRRTRAIVVYPMSALANSQLGELNRYFTPVAPEHKVSYALYTGQASDASAPCRPR